MEVPLALIADLTHRCPLHCVYCSNPLQLASASAELSTQEWKSVFDQCARMCMLHVYLSGGEPLARQDVIELIRFVHDAALYTNMITSGIGLSDEKLAHLFKAGPDHIQLSFQNSREVQPTGSRVLAPTLASWKWPRTFGKPA
jgi:PqqA peptide cyclase